MKMSIKLACLAMMLTQCAISTKAQPQPQGASEKYYKKLATIEECEKIYKTPRCPSIIVFNSTTCTACDQMEPTLNKLARKYTRARFYTYTVPDKGLKKIHERGVFNVPAFPTTYFIKPRAEARKERGAMGAQEFENITYQHIYGKPKPDPQPSIIKKSLQEKIENYH